MATMPEDKHADVCRPRERYEFLTGLKRRRSGLAKVQTALA
jgi:hypothetical protein